MHLLLILILLCLIWPAFARFLGGSLSTILWLIAVVIVLAIFGALSH
jgi:hypothetical protein